MSNPTYDKLIQLLDENKADYRLIDHAEEWRTELVSKMRGNELKQAANCIILMVKISKKEKQYVLAVYPAHVKLDLDAVKDLFWGKYVSFADKDKAEALAGSVLGTVLPFPFHDDLALVVDKQLLDNDELFFNAARLDQSVALKASDYKRIADPRLENIVEWSAKKEKKESASSSNEEIFIKRHSLSHAMSQAVMEMYPNAKRGVGPAIDNGFYQDFDFGDEKIHEEDLKTIEKKAKQILKQNQKFEQSTMSIDEGLDYFKDDPYKVELIEDLKKDGETEISIYTNYAQNGDKKYEDLCKGPHVDQFSRIDQNSFQIDRIAGAYWKGDADNKMMTRIYGVAFDTREELEQYNKLMAEAKKRDHRVIGQKLGLFTFSEIVGAGLPLFLPNGEIIKYELEKYMREEKEALGFKFVTIPHIAKKELYDKSGHMGKYDAMMPVMSDSVNKAEFVIKPMNCPHHFELYNAQPHSYRELPLRFAENTTCYRNEKTGELSGLTRVKALTQDDAHLFVRHDQIEAEIEMVLWLMEWVYKTFGFEKFKVEISVRDPKTPDMYFGDNDVWDRSEATLIEVVKRWWVEYSVEEGEAAFYGPKIDIRVEDAIGRDWQLTTVQLDFIQPENFDMTYIGEDGEKHRPAVLHVAILGSSHRFMWVMIEHFAGIFPLWLAPRQAIVVPVSNNFDDYGYEVLQKLKDAWLRAEIDDSNDGLNKKVRNAEKSHINYILVVGEQEQKDGSVAVRNYKTKEQSDENLQNFIGRAVEERNSRSL